MAISSSVVTKVGAASTITASVGLGGTYLAWDWITLYAVEREVLEKDLKLVVEDPTTVTGGKKIVVKALGYSAGSTSTTLPENYDWSCEITVNETDDTKVKDLAAKLKDNLPTSNSRVQFWDKNKKSKARKLLVKACAGDRETTNPVPSNLKVKGKLTLKKDGNNNFKFEKYTELDYLLDSKLKTVEREVIEKDLKLTTTNDTSTITIKAETNGDATLTTNYSWSCKITPDSGLTSEIATLKGNIQKHLYSATSGETMDDTKRNNKELLVRACSEAYEGTVTDTSTSIVGKLALKKKDNSKFFENHQELNHFLV